ncbi:NAD(P)H-dependent oxidoreductase subunit E [Escherichia coli]|uniref:NAD(P)H-dependent oxidoreductase subunit E n=1 Tax=Escherichia coli TaxID=562 RepID=UPI003D9B0F5F
MATFYSRSSASRLPPCDPLCDSVVCHINGYQGIQAALEKKLNIKPGQRHLTVALRCCQLAAWGTVIRAKHDDR